MTRRWPDPAVLELLVAVAEHGSVGAAARALDLAQPNASRALRGLEHDLRVTLLDRGPHGSTLTREGELVVTWARGVLGQAQTLLDGVDLLRRERAARVGVAATSSIAEHLMPMWVAELRSSARARAAQWYRPASAAPATPAAEVQVDLFVGPTDEVLDCLVAARAGIGFTDAPVRRAGLESHVFTSEALRVVVGPHHPWARREHPLTAAELARTPLALPPPGSSVRAAVDRALAPYGGITPAAERATTAGLLTLATAGALAAVVGGFDAAQPIRSGRVVAVRVADLALARPLLVVWPKGGRPTGPTGELARIVLARSHPDPADS